MRNRIALVFFLVVAWQLVGVTSWFELSRIQIRQDIKAKIKKGVPDHELTQFTFSSVEVENLIWLKKNEFSLNGRLYDVVYRTTNEDGKVVLKCIDDIQEKKLFASLGESTARNLGDETHPTPLFFCVKQLFAPAQCHEYNEMISIILKKDLNLLNSRYLQCVLSGFSKIESPPPCALS